jgi:hypothetical protein
LLNKANNLLFLNQSNDIYAKYKGYYTFEECPEMMNPTIGMEYGVAYTFNQADRSNWYHPLGFAYSPVIAHNNGDELEPGMSLGSDDSCVNTTSCPAPLYFRDGLYLGSTTDPLNFGLDVFKSEFARPIMEWSGVGPYTIQLTFDDESYTKDIFYFCHVRFLCLFLMLVTLSEGSKCMIFASNRSCVYQ